MSLHLQKFIERVKGSESRGNKDVVIPLIEAKNTAFALTELLLELRALKENTTSAIDTEIIQVAMNGGTFKNTK